MPIEALVRTTPPIKSVVLFDGACKFCVAQMKKLIALARPGAIETIDFQQPGALTAFPGITYEACMQAMHLITPEGKVYRGFEAAVQAVATRPVLGKLAYAYYLPGLRWLFDRSYAFVAAHRYRIMGKTIAAEGCEGGTCSLHFPPPRASQKEPSHG